MSTKEELKAYLKKTESRFDLELPRVLKEIKVFEQKKWKGELKQPPKAAPQFNG